MKRSCQYCGRIHDDGFVCSRRPKRKSAGQEQSRFRSASAWTEKSMEIRRRDLFLCRICLEKNLIQQEGLSVHHIVPLAENIALGFENDNLITLCETDHRLAEAGKISREHLRELAKGPPRGCDWVKTQIFARPHGPIKIQSFPKMALKGGTHDGKTSQGN